MIVRSTKELTYEPRDSKTGIIALRLTDWTREEKFNRFKAVVEDLKQIPIENPEPGQPLSRYEVINRKNVIYQNAEIDGLFTQINQPIQPSESYTDRLKELIAQALLIVTQQKPIYGSVAEDWELVDETLEIQPEP